jgi:hypothetical protein
MLQTLSLFDFFGVGEFLRVSLQCRRAHSQQVIEILYPFCLIITLLKIDAKLASLAAITFSDPFNLFPWTRWPDEFVKKIAQNVAQTVFATNNT